MRKAKIYEHYHLTITVGTYPEAMREYRHCAVDWASVTSILSNIPGPKSVQIIQHGTDSRCKAFKEGR